MSNGPEQPTRPQYDGLSADVVIQAWETIRFQATECAHFLAPTVIGQMEVLSQAKGGIAGTIVDFEKIIRGGIKESFGGLFTDTNAFPPAYGWFLHQTTEMVEQIIQTQGRFVRISADHVLRPGDSWNLNMLGSSDNRRAERLGLTQVMIVRNIQAERAKQPASDGPAYWLAAVYDRNRPFFRKITGVLAEAIVDGRAGIWVDAESAKRLDEQARPARLNPEQVDEIQRLMAPRIIAITADLERSRQIRESRQTLTRYNFGDIASFRTNYYRADVDAALIRLGITGEEQNRYEEQALRIAEGLLEKKAGLLFLYGETINTLVDDEERAAYQYDLMQKLWDSRGKDIADILSKLALSTEGKGLGGIVLNWRKLTEIYQIPVSE